MSLHQTVRVGDGMQARQIVSWRIRKRVRDTATRRTEVTVYVFTGVQLLHCMLVMVDGRRVSTSLYFGLCTIRLRCDSCRTDGNSCRVYMHRGLYLLDVRLLNLEATVMPLSAHHFGFSAPCKYENLARKKAHRCCGVFDH